MSAHGVSKDYNISMYTNDIINYQKSQKTNIGYVFPCKTLGLLTVVNSGPILSSFLTRIGSWIELRIDVRIERFLKNGWNGHFSKPFLFCSHFCFHFCICFFGRSLNLKVQCRLHITLFLLATTIHYHRLPSTTTAAIPLPPSSVVPHNTIGPKARPPRALQVVEESAVGVAC